MKQTEHNKGHRWTNEELKTLMNLWQNGNSTEEIATQLNSTKLAIGRMVVRLRKNGIPLARRTKGHVAGRSNKPWTQAEVEYLMRRRNEKATAEEIGNDLGRTPNAVHGMIQNLVHEGVSIAMQGQGVRKLWDANLLKSTMVESNIIPIEKAA